MLDRKKLRHLRDERGFRKAMDNNGDWVALELSLYRTDEDECYYEIEKHHFFTKDGKKDGENELLEHGSCAWSDVAFENYLSPIWERFISIHRENDYSVTDWTALEDEVEREKNEFWAEISDDGVKYNCSSPEDSR